MGEVVGRWLGAFGGLRATWLAAVVKALRWKSVKVRDTFSHALPFAEYNESPSITIFLCSIFNIHSCMVSLNVPFCSRE